MPSLLLCCLAQLEESVRLLASHFASERTCSDSGVAFGLYARWSSYVRPAAQLMRGLLVTCVNTAVRDLQAGAVDPQTGACVRRRAGAVCNWGGGSFCYYLTCLQCHVFDDVICCSAVDAVAVPYQSLPALAPVSRV